MDASIIAVWGRSGVGKSTLAVNLACALADTRCVGLISSNLQYGHLQSFCGQTIENGKGLLNALENPAHTKEYFWKAASNGLLENVFLLTVPNEYTGLQADCVSMEAVEVVLDHARALFDVIIVDASEDVTNPVSGVALTQARQVVVVHRPSVASGLWFRSMGDFIFQLHLKKYHTFTYETKLTTSHNISPQTFKSGYGFAATLSNSISTRQTGNQGCGSWGNSRANTKIPSPPGKAQVKLGWTVTNRLGTQSSTVDLNLLSRTATQSKFEPRPNPISEINSKLIFTDVALAGTKQNPKEHQFIISIVGGGVNGVPFCKEITDKITINGNMYEDDATGAN